MFLNNKKTDKSGGIRGPHGPFQRRKKCVRFPSVVGVTHVFNLYIRKKRRNLNVTQKIMQGRVE